MSSKARGRVVFALKVAVAALLLGWLMRSGALDFGALGVLFEQPALLAIDLGVFALGVMVGALRWRVLLELAGVALPLGRALRLQLSALFFNVVIPGNVGGDVIKALYVARDEAPAKRTPILLVVFVERLMGLAGLVAMAVLVTAARAPSLLADPRLRPMVYAVGLLGLAVVVGPAVFVLVMRRAGDRLDAWTSGPSKLSKLLNQLVAAIRLLSSGPKNLLIALTLSMALHATTMGFFTILTRVVTAQDVSYAAIATVFPFGVLTMIIPVSVAGFGVGHVAFDRLFEAIGLSGGATIFNVYLIGQIAPCLLGVIPYLALRKKGGRSVAELSAEEPKLNAPVPSGSANEPTALR